MSDSRILEVAELDFRVEPFDWPFARERESEIRAHWDERSRAQPTLFNGRVLLLARHEIETRAEGKVVLRGVYFETDFADFLAWRDFGFPGGPVCNGFAMAALQGSDGAFLLGEMAAHTANAGAIYFPSGTPDPHDVFGDRVDLAASVTRELEEETGIRAAETTFGEGWIIVREPPRIACLKIMRLPVPAETVKARIEAFLARDTRAELARMHVARSAADLDAARAPGFVRDFLAYAFSQRSVG